MKRAVSISLGSRIRDKEAEIVLGRQTIQLARIGCDGDERKARQLFTELDGQVDAFGVGGVELEVRVEQRRYPLRSGQRLVKAVRNTPYTDGGGLKHTIERQIFQQVEALLPPISPRRALVPMACDRYGLAKSLVEAGFEILCGDLQFGLGLPIPVRGLKQLQQMSQIVLPVVGQLPISWVYPTGDAQTRQTPRYQDWFDYGPIIASDFQYIRRNLPLDMRGKIIITNTTTAEDVELLRARGVSWLITSTPRLNGRSFGTNLMEAALIAYSGKKRPLTDNEVAELLIELDVKPQVIQLN